MAAKWTPESWRSQKGIQMPVYRDQAALAAVEAQLGQFPPLVFAGEARNLRKVASDFYLQGFCACSLTLMPSTFYGSASLRGAATRPPPAAGVVSRALCARLAPSCPWDKA